MATYGSVVTETRYESYFFVEWTLKEIDTPNVRSIINWSCGLVPGHKYYKNAIRMSAVTINGEEVYSGGTYSDITNYEKTIFASGTLAIRHDPNDGTKTFTISGFTGWLYGHGNYTAKSQNFSLPSITVYTNCTPPSNVQFSNSPSFLSPRDSSITVTWNPGIDGTYNPINEYRAYYCFSSDGKVPTESSAYKGVISDTSARIPLNEENRGMYLRVGVQARSQHNNTSLIYTDPIPVNSLPNSPSVSFTSKTIPSTQTSVTITDISPGNLNFGSKTGSVWWASSSTGSKTKLSSNSFTDSTLSSLVQGNSKNYYFWTYDGFEYSSSYTIVTITKNIKPAIIVELTSSKNSTVTGASNVLETVGFTVTAQNKACYYTVKILRGTGADEKTLYTLKSDSYLSSSGMSEEINRDIRSLGLSEGDFYFHFACNDYIESGESIIIKDDDGSNYYSPALPTFSNDTTYNQLSEINVPGANSINFYQNLRFALSNYDSYVYENGTFRLDTGSNETISYTVTKGKDSDTSPEKIFYDVIITSNLMPGQSYDFFPTLQLAGLTSSALVSRYQTPILDPTPSFGSPLYIKPFTDGWDRIKNKSATSSKKISISKGTFTDNELTKFYNYYNIDENSKWWTSEIITPDNKKIDVTDLVKGGALSGDYYERKFEITGSIFFTKLSEISNKTGILICALKNSITNRFGQTISKQSSIVTLDFNENPEIISISKTAKNTEYLYEDGILQLEYKYRTYSKNKITYSYLINRNDGNGVVTYGEIQTNEDMTSPSFGTGRLISETVNIGIGEITSSDPCTFNMRFYDGNSISYDTNFDISCKRIRFVNPAISFGKATYNKERTGPSISCQYTISDYGYDPDQVGVFSISKESLTLNLSTTESLSPSIEDAVFHPDDEIIDFKIGRLTLTTAITYNNHTSKEKSFTSNDLIIYGITPTVAYRQNHLGINTSTLQNNSLLTIAPTSGRNIIYLQKVGSADTFKINLETGALEGFVFNIDCGEIK